MKKLYFVFGALILLSGVFFAGRWSTSTPPSEAPENAIVDKRDIEDAANDIYQSKKVTLESIQSSLAWADEQSLEATRSFVSEINELIKNREGGTVL